MSVGRSTPRQRILSIELIPTVVFLLQRVSLFQAIVHLRRNQDEILPDDRLEGYTILSSIICSDTPYPNFEGIHRDIARRLDELAEQVKQQITPSSSTDNDKVRVINHVLFEQQGFMGNVDHYYLVQNSLLDALLDSKKAIPMTLAILYKLVAQRVGLTVDVIGLPGHIIVSVPSLENCFIDVFRQGRILNMPAIANIVQAYGFRFHPQLLKPLSPENILERVCNNLANCAGMEAHVAGVTSQRVFLVDRLKRMLYNPSAQLVETCHAGLGRMWLSENGSSELTGALS